MQLVALTLACAALVAADVSHLQQGGGGEAQAAILKQSADVGPDGSYAWDFETANGIAAQAQGQLKNAGQENEAQVVQGNFGWTGPEGEKFQIQYLADENGYQPQGAAIPTPPPVPEAILRALEYIAAHPPPKSERAN